MRAIVAASFAVLLAAGAGLRASADTANGPPVYPDAVAGERPSGVGFKAPPPQTKAYVTADDFAKVQSWYRAHLPGAQEVAQPGMERTEDAFLIGSGASAAVVMVQAYDGKTWILIGPPL